MVHLDLSKDLDKLAEDIFNKVSPCFEQAQVYSESERIVREIRDKCCGESDTLPCRRDVRTLLNRVDLGRRGVVGHFPKLVADRVSNELDKLESAWRKELTTAPRTVLVEPPSFGFQPLFGERPKPEELRSELFRGVPEEIVDCAESDFILDGIEKFMRWQSHLAFAECVCERGLLR